MNKAYLIVPLVGAIGLLASPFLLYYGNIIMVVTSDSMAPALEPYDMVVVHRTSIEQVKVGDIIVFDVAFDGVERVVHRVVKIFDDNGRIGISTKGDNSESVDGWIVHGEDLVGKVVSSTLRVGVFLLDPIRYALSAFIMVTAVLLVFEVKGKPPKLEKS